MEVTKTTKNSYLLYPDGNNYILNMFTIKRGEDTTTELLFEEVDNPQKTTITTKCGCVITDKENVESDSFTVKVKYTHCEGTFDKTITVNEGKADNFRIKIKGKC